MRAATLAIERGAQRTDAPCQLTDFRQISAKPLCTIKHSITRYRITLEARRAQLAKRTGKIPGRWLTLKQLHRLAFTSAHKKILARLEFERPRKGRALRPRLSQGIESFSPALARLLAPKRSEGGSDYVVTAPSFSAMS
jgi:hypothetical protein